MTYHQTTLLDQYIARIQNIPAFNIYGISTDGHSAKPWWEVTSDQIIRELVLNELTLGHQAQIISGQIQTWGRLSSQARRVWELEERGYRAWRSSFFLKSLEPPIEDEEKPGWGLTAKGEPKPPTKETIEALYRTHPKYHDWQARIERAEEAYNATEAVLNGFRAKKDMLNRYVYRSAEDGMARMSV